MTYQERLNPWVVQQQSSSSKVWARFRRPNDAEAYRVVLQSQHPHMDFTVAFITANGVSRPVSLGSNTP
ncbi:MAG: hypothetical protein AAF289_15355 [Cyanobacteria bacterium P01_A01_bin.135]